MLFHKDREKQWFEAVHASMPCAASSPSPRVSTFTIAPPFGVSFVIVDWRWRKLPEDLEVLSIDVDGGDYWLWESLEGSRWSPKIVVVEFNPTIPNRVHFVQVREARREMNAKRWRRWREERNKKKKKISCTCAPCITLRRLPSREPSLSAPMTCAWRPDTSSTFLQLPAAEVYRGAPG